VAVKEIVMQLGIRHSGIEEMMKTLEWESLSSLGSLTADRWVQKGIHGCAFAVISTCCRERCSSIEHHNWWWKLILPFLCFERPCTTLLTTAAPASELHRGLHFATQRPLSGPTTTYSLRSINIQCVTVWHHRRDGGKTQGIEQIASVVKDAKILSGL
jgi:hypothetical protein